MVGGWILPGVRISPSVSVRALLFAGLLLQTAGASARVLPPEAAGVLQKALGGLDPSWRLERAVLDREEVRLSLCGVASGVCKEVRLTDPEPSCPESSRFGAFCLQGPPDSIPPDLHESLRQVLSAVSSEEVWRDLTVPVSGSRPEASEEDPPGPLPVLNRWAAALLLLTIGFLGLLFGAAGTWGLRRVLAGHGGWPLGSGPVVLGAWALLLGVGLWILPWSRWGDWLAGMTLVGVGVLVGLAMPADARKALRAAGLLLLLLLGHGLGAEWLLGRRAAGNQESNLSWDSREVGPDVPQMVGPSCATLFPEEPPSIPSYVQMRRHLREDPTPRLWLHLGSDLVLEEPSGRSLPDLVAQQRPGEVHWSGALAGGTLDLAMRQALSWTAREPRPAGVLLSLVPARDLPRFGQRNACCGGQPLFAFPEGEPVLSCDRPDLQGRWRVLLGHLRAPGVFRAWESSALVRALDAAWERVSGGLLASREDRAAAESRLRTLLPWLWRQLANRGVDLRVVLLPTAEDLSHRADPGPANAAWPRVQEICRVLDLPCLDGRLAWTRGPEGHPPIAPFRPDGRLSAEGQRRLARWLAESLATLDNSPGRTGPGTGG